MNNQRNNIIALAQALYPQNTFANINFLNSFTYNNNNQNLGQHPSASSDEEYNSDDVMSEAETQQALQQLRQPKPQSTPFNDSFHNDFFKNDQPGHQK